MHAPIQNEAAAKSTLRCELITNFRRLEELSPDWERLWRADPYAEIFQNFAWARAWWRCYEGKVSLCSLALFEAERVVGIVPLVTEDDRIVFLAGGPADYCNFLCEDGREAEVLEAALETLLLLPQWKECVLLKIKAGGRILKALPMLPRRLRRHLQLMHSDDCHTILLGENRNVLATLLGKNHTKRRLNKLRRAGALTFRHIETKAEAQAQLSNFFRHQVRRHALAGKGSPTPEFRRFMGNLIDEFDLSKELRFGVLALDDHPLAWHLSFYAKGKLLFYQQTFDVDVWDYSPGEVLMHELLRYAQENVTLEFDFTRGNEPFKDRFTTHVLESYTLYIEPNGLVGQLRRALRASAAPWLQLTRRLQHLAKRHDETFHRFRSIRLWASGMRARIRYHRQKKTLMSWAAKGFVRVFRSKRPGRAQIELLPQMANAEAPGVSSSKVSVREGGLGDLVDLALQHPEIVVPFELANYRRRLKRGDHVYLVWQGQEVVLVGWTTTHPRNDNLAISARQDGSEDAPLMVLYECWVVSHPLSELYYQQLLCAVLKEAKNRQLTLGVCHADPAPALPLKSHTSRSPV